MLHWGPRQLPRHGLHQFVHLRVGELSAFVPATSKFGGVVKVGHPAQPFHPGLAMRDDHLCVQLLSLPPKPVHQLDAINPEGAEPGLRGDDGPGERCLLEIDGSHMSS